MSASRESREQLGPVKSLKFSDLLQTYHPTPQTGNPKKLASLRWVTPDELRQGVYARRVLLTDKDSRQPAHALEVLTRRKTLARLIVLTDDSLRADK